MSLLGLIMLVITATFVTILRITPATAYRIDDARSTRGLHTWLTRDISSTPPAQYDVASRTGYVDGSFADPSAGGVPAADVCTTSGTHVLFMAWLDRGTSYRAQYTIEGDPTTSYRVVRTICGGDSGRLPLTGEVSLATCALSPPSTFNPVDADNDLVFEAATVDLCLVSAQTESGLLGGDGQQEVTLSVASRNGDV
jgi:hypothetical protein